jgi:hypothetical protein
MRKFLPGLAVFAGVVSMPIRVSYDAGHAPPPDYRADTRLGALQDFFGRFDCPAVDYAVEFLEAADAYDLDWRLLPSISYIESTGGKLARNNNVFGWDSGRAQFASMPDAIRQVGYRLTHSSLYRDKDLEALLATYNPSATYAQRVKTIMHRIAPSE